LGSPQRLVISRHAAPTFTVVVTDGFVMASAPERAAGLLVSVPKVAKAIGLPKPATLNLRQELRRHYAPIA
jgi:hypothetical protein